MIVVDASAVVALVLSDHRAERVAGRLLDEAAALHAPHLISLEVAHALRRLERTGRILRPRAAEALSDYGALRLERHAHESLLPRIWELRANLTTYDASYVALAEALDAPLVTCDEKLAAAPGHRARVEVV